MQEYIVNALLIVVALLALVLQIIGRRPSAAMTRKQKVMLWRILAATVLLLALQTLSPAAFEPLGAAGRWVRLALFLADYLIIGYDILRKACKGIRNGQVFDENFLMAVATLGALVLAVYENGEYLEAIAVMLFYQVGEWFQSYAVGKSRRNISELMDIRPDYANVEQEGQLEQVDPDEVEVGDIIVIKAGERIPLDCRVVSGESMVDTSALTGESVPRRVSEGSEIISGCVNGSGLLRVEVTKEFDDSTVARILELVENAADQKARVESFITRFAHWYTPCVVIGAALLAVIPPLFFSQPWGTWVERALVFLVVSCPCALVVSVPLTFFGGIGGASKCGILVKGGNYLEALAKADTVVFDKTGTLTKGTFAVSAVHPEAGFEADQVLEYAALAEQYSTHPIAVSLREACKSGMDRSRVANVEEIAGHGIMAEVDGKRVGVGNSRLMERQSVNWLPCELPGTIVHVTIDGFYAGHIVIADQPKPDAKEAIVQLKAMGVKKTVMLTGDAKEVAHTVADALGLDEYHAELLPADKVARGEELLKQETGKLAFVGDGINDAPVLTRADIGIAMGGLGSDAAIEAADIVLMDDQPTKIAAAIRIARKTVRIVRENIVFALTVKAIVLVMGALGKAPMWLAVFADVGVAFLAILNAMRCLYTEKDKK